MSKKRVDELLVAKHRQTVVFECECKSGLMYHLAQATDAEWRELDARHRDGNRQRLDLRIVNKYCPSLGKLVEGEDYIVVDSLGALLAIRYLREPVTEPLGSRFHMSHKEGGGS